MDEWRPIDEHTPRDGRLLRLVDPVRGETSGSNRSSAPIGWAANGDPYLGWPDDAAWISTAGEPLAPKLWRF